MYNIFIYNMFGVKIRKALFQNANGGNYYIYSWNMIGCVSTNISYTHILAPCQIRLVLARKIIASTAPLRFEKNKRLQQLARDIILLSLKAATRQSPYFPRFLFSHEAHSEVKKTRSYGGCTLLKN